MTKETKLQVAYQDAKDILDSLNIEYGPIANVIIGKKRRAWGTCKRINGQYIIDINPVLLEDGISWESLMNTMVHELLHAHKDRMCHTGEWKRLAMYVNAEYPYLNIKRCSSADEKGVTYSDYTIRRSSVKYEITCTSCGCVNYYRRKSRVVNLILNNPTNSSCRCGRCGSGNFEILDLTNI